MTTTKVNVGLTLSRNFQSVKLEMVDEPIEHNDDAEFRAAIQKRFDIIKEIIEVEYTKL